MCNYADVLYTHVHVCKNISECRVLTVVQHSVVDSYIYHTLHQLLVTFLYLVLFLSPFLLWQTFPLPLFPLGRQDQVAHMETLPSFLATNNLAQISPTTRSVERDLCCLVRT